MRHRQLYSPLYLLLHLGLHIRLPVINQHKGFISSNTRIMMYFIFQVIAIHYKVTKSRFEVDGDFEL